MAAVFAVLVAVSAFPVTAQAAIWDDIASLFGLANEPAPTAVTDAVAVVDGDTFDSYDEYLTVDGDGTTYSTENIGRIWTDKSVLSGDRTLTGYLAGQTIEKNEDSDFLVSLSALSSTSNLLTENVQPLDIVLVLDTSGSMADAMASDSFEITYNVSQNSGDSYFVRDNSGEYHLLTYWNEQQTWYYYEEDGSYNTYQPKENANDNRPNRYTFYTTEDTRLNALKLAVNSFIDATATENDSIDNGNLRHQISIISYAEGSTVRSGLTAYTSSSTNTIKNIVNSLTAGGSTYAHNGLLSAQSQLQSARPGAQKVVIFFTDGEPNEGSGFWPNVAGQAVNTAGQMKEDGTLVYTIGVFGDANPSDTQSNFNIYMNGVSSNYPAASATYNGSGTNSTWNCTLGTRVEGNYYKAATNADELNSIFSEIESEITATRVPTNTSGGYNASGYVTFTDELGPYMELDDFNSIIYNNTIYSFANYGSSSSTRVDANGTVVADTEGIATKTTYTFTEKVTGNGVKGDDPDANLSDIIITVTHYDDASKGDLVTVAIPASLIPLREFNVDTTGTTPTMTVNERYPIRVFYDVSIRDGIAEPLTDADGSITQQAAINNPDETLQNYIDTHKNANGQVYFYTNAYTVDAEDGDTTAQFTPSDSNAFYYFATGAPDYTPVYTDEACAQRATLADINAERAKYKAEQKGEVHENYRTFYYKHEFYTAQATNGSVTNAPATPDSTVYEFSGRNFSLGDNNWATDDGTDNATATVHINAKAHRVSYVASMKTEKTDNATETATNVLNPSYDDEDAGGQVTVRLGNNGRIAVNIPGTLTVTKTVSVPADSGLSVEKYQSTNFDYTLTLTAPTGGTLPESLQAIKTAADGTTSNVVLNAIDSYAFTLKHGEQIVIYGLEDGTGYTVTEAVPSGFTAFVNNEEGNTSTGTISSIASESAATAFTNVYSAEPVTLDGETYLPVSKTFNNWTEDSTFTFQMSSTRDGDPLPGGLIAAEGIVATIDMGNADGQLSGDGTKTGSFGDIIFTKPDRYTYSIWEVTPEPDSRVPGVSYSSVAYGLEVVVEDGDNGALVITSANLYKLTDDNGDPLTPEQIETAGPVQDNLAAFTNTYSADDAEVEILATKSYTNTSNPADDLQNNAFKFRLSQTEGTEPMPASSADNPETGLKTAEVGNLGGSVDFRIAYGVDDLGEIYTYTLREVNDGRVGMTYDDTVYYVTVEVVSTEVDGAAVIAPVVKYYDGDPTAAGTREVAERSVVFSNTYDPEDLVLGTDTKIVGQKTLTGRDAKTGETFEFTLSLDKNATAKSIQDGVSFGADDTMNTEGATVVVTDAKKDATSTFDFGTITFSKVGTYVFNVTESNAPTQDVDGMAYDRHMATVTVKVRDDNGTLVLDDTNDDAITYSNAGAPHDAANTTAAAFTNTYTAGGETDYGTGTSTDLTFTKTLAGRSMRADEFSFTIRGTDELSQNKFADATRTSGVAVDSGTPRRITALPQLTFNENEVGTYTYIIDEIEPEGAEAGVLNGVTYDQSQYKVTISVTDNGDGTLEVEDTITHVKNADGTDANEPVTSIAFTNTYVPASAALDGATNLTVTKNLSADSRGWLDTDSFTFTLAAGDDATSAAVNAGTVELPENASGITIAGATPNHQASFGGITFKAAGTYKFVVAEDTTAVEGVTFDTDANRTVTVSVTDDGQGHLSAAVVTDQSDSLAFTNSIAKTEDHKDVSFSFDPTTSVDGKLVGVGDELTYTITWVNDAVDETTGNAAAADVTVIDTVPSGTTFVSASAGGELNDGVVTWNLGEQPAGATGTVTLTVKVAEDAVTYDDISNSASITVGDHEAKTTNTTHNTVPQKSEVTNPGSIEVGQTLTYQVSFTNTDGAGATAEVVDALAEGLQYQEGSATVTVNGNEKTAEPAASGQTLTWNLTDLPENAEVTVTFSVTVTRDALTTVDNRATVNGHSSNVVTTPVPGDSAKHAADASGTTIDGKLVGVGDAITYSINWANGDADGDVTIVDTLPVGVTVDEESITAGGTYNAEAGTITWALADQPAGKRGTVSFSVTVADANIDETGHVGTIKNTATVNGTEVSVTNYVPGKSSEDSTPDTKLEVGDELTYTVAYKNTEDAPATVTVTDKVPAGTEFVSADGDAEPDADGTLTWTVPDVAAGAEGTVSFTVRVTQDAANGTIENQATVQIGDRDPGYKTDTDKVTVEDSGTVTISKTVEGTAAPDAEFSFTLGLTDAEGEALTGEYETSAGEKVSDGSVITLADGESLTISDLPVGGTVTATETAAAGFTPSVSAANGVTVDAAGTATATVPAAGNVELAFTNTYAASLNYGAAGGLSITKILAGRDMADGQFSFTVKPADASSAEKLGISQEGTSFSAPAADDGTTVAISLIGEKGLTFTQADDGAVFRYTVSENGTAPKGYAYDGTVYDVSIAVADNGDGTLTATTTITPQGADAQVATYVYTTGASDQDAAVIPFANSYFATTDPDDPKDPDGPSGYDGRTHVSVTKTLSGRPMVAGEFSFQVSYQGQTAALTTATNAADGTVDLGTFSYSTTSIKEAIAAGAPVTRTTVDGKPAWPFRYTASEVTDDLPEGVSAGRASFDFTVTVVDNGDGTMTATSSLPANAGFANTYTSTGEGGQPVSVTPAGSKVVSAAGGLTPADLTGKFTFTLSSDDPAAPLPASVTATNDAQGNVTFGAIEFTLDDLNAALGESGEKDDAVEAEAVVADAADAAEVDAAAPAPRSHTFTYQVTESGSAAGVTNDVQATKTFSYTVTDDGQGHLTVTSSAAAGSLFSFTNTYSVTSEDSTPTDDNDGDGVADLTLTKQLTGRDMAEGEFTFQLKDAAGDVVSEGSNAADGSVALSAVTFTEPGTYAYTLSEVDGGLGGVTYDGSEHAVVATVTDNGDGTLSVSWAVDGAPAPAEVTFANTYEAKGTWIDLRAAKVLTGRELADGEFTFELLEGGEAVGTAANAADGSVSFGRIAYDEPGEHDYQVREVAGDAEGVTYDDAVYAIHVSVTDDGAGQLQVDWSYGEAGEPVFRNAYEAGEPAMPEPDDPTPAKPAPEVPETGDSTNVVVPAVLLATGVAVLAIAWRRRRA